MSTKHDLIHTEHYLHEKIPITRAMGVRVESYDAGNLILTAPLAMNHNHLGTAFGGSLVSVATLAGYSLLWLEIGESDSHLVIRKSSAAYHHPVRGDIRAICHRPDPGLFAAFKKAFTQKGKARIPLHVTIEEEGRVAMTFEATYVAMR